MKNATGNSSTYKIFGEPTLIKTEFQDRWNIIEEEFKLYDVSRQHAMCEIILPLDFPPPQKNLQRARSESEWTRGLRIQEKLLVSDWTFGPNAPVKIQAQVREFPNPLPHAYRFLHRQYTSRKEMLGQLLHEQLLVPRCLVHKERAVLHASAVLPPGCQRPICFGGVGGAGKTSLMLKACLDKFWAFCADDFCVLSTKGDFFPNFAYPKIYGYNLDAFPSLKTLVTKKRSPIDRIHWKLHRMRGPDKVRRRISPGKLANLPEKKQLLPPSDYILLLRNHDSEFTLKEIEAAKAARASAEVLATEFNSFSNHIHWARFQYLLESDTNNKRTPMLTQLWSDRIQQSLSCTRCWVLRIPNSLSHKDYLKGAWPLIENLIS